MPPVSALNQSDRSAVLAPDDVLQNRYRIVRQLGKGGMGAVYEAVDQRLDATVALKETFSVDVRLRRQFEQEARLLAQLHHPALPRVSDYFTEGDRAFLVMQYISGVDLAEIIAKQPGPFPRNQVVAWADQLLDALIYLHTRDRQIIHRDIKPHNLKLTSTGKIALLDFGLAKAQSADHSTTNSSGSIFGYTRRYAPLEQIQDQGTSPQSDIYALGATLYHLLTGVKPADALARAAALVNSRPDPLRPANDIHPSVGAEITAILYRAMAQNPAERYASASDFREALWRVGRDDSGIFESSEQLVNARPASSATVGKRILGTAAARSVDPFDSYSILKPQESDWFSPAQKRGPGALAGILFLLFIAIVGSLYGYRRWTESSTSGLNSVPSAERFPTYSTAVHQIKPEKTRDFATSFSRMTPVSAIDNSRKVEAKEQNETRERQAFRVDGASSSAPVSEPHSSRGRQAAVVERVSVPNPRLPNAELQESGPAPSIRRLPAFGQPEAVSERQVLRAPDGTQVVKFSDGTTRVFRPGEKIAQSAVAPK